MPVVLVCGLLVSGCPNVANVAVERAGKVTESIGPEGGEVSCTASGGTVYTLSIPADALADAVDITITPVTSIANLPLSGGLAGAVELAPPGLAFARPATLTIEGAAAPPAGQIAIGFGFEGDASSFEVALANADNGRLTVLVQHFSGSGVGFGTLQDVSGMPGGAICDPALQNAVIALTNTAHQPQDEATFFGLLFRICILPQLQNATNDAELVLAVSNYEMWASLISAAASFTVVPRTSSAFANERQQAAQAAAPQLRAAIEGNNALCGSAESFSALANVLFWQKQAALFGVDTPSEQLDRATVLLGLCVEIVMDPPSLPDTLQAGFPHSLDLRFGVRFKGHPDEQGAPFEVNLSASGATLDTPSGFTAVDGSYTTVVTATGNGPVTIEGTACLILPGTVTPTDICFPFTINRNGLDISGTYRVDANYSSPLGNDSVSLTLLLSQNQNAISGSYEGTSSVGGALISGIITGTLATTVNGLQLLGLEATQSSPCGASMRPSDPVDLFVFNGLRGFEAVFNDISGCAGCTGPPERQACATEVRFVCNRI